MVALDPPITGLPFKATTGGKMVCLGIQVVALRRIVRPSAHSGGKSWPKVGTDNFELSSLPAAFQIPYTVHCLWFLYKISAKITYLAPLISTVYRVKTRKLKIAKKITL